MKRTTAAAFRVFGGGLIGWALIIDWSASVLALVASVILFSADKLEEPVGGRK